MQQNFKRTDRVSFHGSLCENVHTTVTVESVLFCCERWLVGKTEPDVCTYVCDLYSVNLEFWKNILSMNLSIKSKSKHSMCSLV